MSSTYKQYISGEWKDARNKSTWNVVNPATEESVVAVPFGGGEDCREAIEAEGRAFPAWASATPHERAKYLSGAGDLMRARAEALAETTVRESGKPFA